MIRDRSSAPLRDPSPAERMQLVAQRFVDRLLVSDALAWVPDASPSDSAGSAFRTEFEGGAARISQQYLLGQRSIGYRVDVENEDGVVIVSASASVSPSNPQSNTPGVEAWQTLLSLAYADAACRAEQEGDTILAGLPARRPPEPTLGA